MDRNEIDFFDRLSDHWDDDEVLSTPEKVREVLSHFAIAPGMDILDLGTGTGVLIPYLSELIGESGKIAAVDISDGMLVNAIIKFGNLPNVKFYKKDFEEEALEGEYDRIILYCVYPHLHEPEDTLKRLMRDNLKPGGCIFIAFPTDEKFINNIHGERKAESDLLPPAETLAGRFREWGLDATTVAYSPEMYIVGIRKN
ncbi:MAG: class I SAM-dependent methyltransferase [Paramuribaculum sp.]|nr:class I SAM-dependent methyltransferase [Paramuribaculum sp.]